jgi:hypothetical protein
MAIGGREGPIANRQSPLASAYNAHVSFTGKLRFAKTLLFGGGPMLEVGDVAPEFEVTDHNGRTVKLSDLRGRKVVLWFYPKADTPG